MISGMSLRGTCVALPEGMMNSYTPREMGADAVVGGGAWMQDELDAEIDRWAERIEDEVTAGNISLEEAYELLRERDG
ncbi:MAG: hypothetical protein ACAI38_21850 [Myxococcota bacterium]